MAPAARTALSRLLLGAADALALADVVHGVDEQEDLAVLVGVRRGDVQLPGADRDGPVHAAQPVAEAERPDLVELTTVARVVRPVLARPARPVAGRRREP